jgi:hypothetical protein
MSGPLNDQQCRRAAMNLAAQLPADLRTRARVLEYLRALVPFLDGREDTTGNQQEGGR